MKNISYLSIAIGASTIVLNVSSFNTSPPCNNYSPKLKVTPARTSSSISASVVNSESTTQDASQQSEKNDRLPKYSTAIPFLERPPILTGKLAGDVGFDPLRLAKNEEMLIYYREAEVKHSRLAMLAAAGWPLSELYDEKIATILSLPPIIDSSSGNDRVPSVLNGGLDKVSPAFWGFCLGLSAAIDLYGIERSRAARPGYVPGDLDFDPLGLYPDEDDIVGRERMQLAEIKHGRLAMMSVVGFAVQEAVTKLGVVNETPFFFRPVTESLGGLMEGFTK